MFKCLISVFVGLMLHVGLSAQDAMCISDKFELKMINDLAVSPNGDEVVFAALGKLYLMNIDKQKPERLTNGKREYEFEPAYSRDGSKIVFTSWSDSGYGKLYIYDKESKAKKTLLITSGIYRDPQFSYDDKFITYKKEIEVAKADTANQKTEGLYIVELDGGDPIKVIGHGDNPQFSTDGKHLLYQSGIYRLGSFVKTFESIDLKSRESKTLFYGKYGHEYLISDHGEMVAWQELGRIYMSPFPDQPLGLTADNSKLEIEKISDLPGNNLNWNQKNNTLSWTIANSLYVHDVTASSPLQEIEIKISHPADEPEGMLAFTNARIITGDGSTVIERGTIIVEGNRIVDIGVDVHIPKNAHAIQCSGKTIIPGLIDLSARSNNYEYNLSPIQQWEYVEWLRNGITTKMDGGFRIENGLANRELIAAGRLIGPRLLNGGVSVAAQDTDLFDDESYEHYKQSNLWIAQQFDVAAVQYDENQGSQDFIYLNNVQRDTSKVESDDILRRMIDEANNGDDRLELIRKYTLDNAKVVGLDAHVGSIEKGKLADFIIIDGNPLESIHQLANVSHTIKNGRVYKCSTMEEVGNYRKRISRTPNSALYENLNRGMGSACCGFQH